MAWTEEPAKVEPASTAADFNESLLESRFRLRDELHADRRDHDGMAFFVIEDPVRNNFYRAGEKEFLLAVAFDGEKTVREVAAALAEEGTKYTEIELIAICKWLVQANLVNGTSPASTGLLAKKAESLAAQKLMGVLNPICIKIRLFNPDQTLQKITPYVKWVFSPGFLVVWVLFALLSLQIVWTRWDQIGDSTMGVLAPNRWFWLVVVWFLLKVVHETAHGVACRMYGGTVKEAGVLMLLFTPMAYIDVTSSWKFKKRSHRMIVAGAGIYVEMFVSFVALLLWARLPSGQLADLSFYVFTMGCITTILFNANPLMRFDGYYLLSDALRVSNLYTKGMRWFSDRMKHWVFGTPKSKGICAPREMEFVAVYGVLAFCWKLLVSFSLVICASVIFNGLGLIMGLVGVVLWFGIPLTNQIRTVIGPLAAPIKPARAIVSIGLVVIFVVGLFTFIQGPSLKSAPAIVQFKNEAIIRAESDGFIEELFVSNGEHVVAGQRLVKLRNDPIETELYLLERRVEEATIQARIYRQTREIDKALGEEEKRRGLEIQLAEKREQMSALTLYSPVDGIVFRHGLENTLGSFAKQGSVLLSVADLNSKEIVISVDQGDYESLKKSIGNPVKVLFPGSKLMTANLAKINPRASDRTGYPSLSAANGGPLPVKPAGPEATGDDRFVLLAPRLTAKLDFVSVNDEPLQSGQRGLAYFQSRSQSLGAYLYLKCDRWLSNKIEQAIQTAPF